jgi:DNA-binding response OmpR family regulator
VNSQPDRGTTFAIELPSTKPGPGPPQGEHSATADDGPTVLVVEHEDNVRTLVGLMLTDAGHRVLEVTNGEQALAILRDPANIVDVMLADLTLVARDQGQIASTATELRAGLTMIYMSAEPEASFRVNGMPPGGFLAKPFTEHDLASSMHHALATGPSPPGQATVVRSP